MITQLQLEDDRPVCNECAVRITPTAVMTDPYENMLCPSCFDSLCGHCANNGQVYWANDLIEAPNGNYYRQAYIDAHYFTCSYCGDLARNSVRHRTENDDDICDDCYCNDFFHCTHCGGVFHNDDYGSDGMCQSCEEEHEDELIQGYHTNVLDTLSAMGKPKDGLFLGVELEVETNMRCRDDVASEVMNRLGWEFCIFKEDGSLSEEGFEIVSVPATLAIHAEHWRKLMVTNPVRGLHSWTHPECGMHVHVTRKALSDLTIGKLLVLVNHADNENFITSIAGRGPNNYCARYPKVVADGSRNRYYRNNNNLRAAINLQGDNTIEFRLFKGTLKFDAFMKNLEFVMSAISFCRQTSIATFQDGARAEYVAFLRKSRKAYPALHAHLVSKGFIPASKPIRSRAVKGVN